MNNKICSLYASDAHLITMINSYSQNEKNIITVFEKDLRNISKKINNNKNNINWNKTSIDEILNYDNLENKVIIISGKREFIRKANDFINAKVDNLNNVQIINCYYIFENNIKIKEIIKNYPYILTTQGIEKLSNYLIYNK